MERKKKSRRINRLWHSKAQKLSIKCPRILSAALFFLLGSEIVFNVECSTNLIRSLPLDHVSNSKAGQIQKRLHVEVIGSEDKFKKGTLVYFAKFSVPSLEFVIDFSLARVVFAVGFGGFCLDVLGAIFYDLGEDAGANIRKGDIFTLADICKRRN